VVLFGGRGRGGECGECATAPRTPPKPKRRCPTIVRVIRILIFALAAVGLFVIARRLFALPPAGADLKCAECIHCRKLFRDGVLCGFREKEVFKNLTHIDMCPDLTHRGN